MAKKRINKHLGKFKEIIITGITTALGLVIALSWKDVLMEYFGGLASLSPIHGKIVTAIIITIFAAITLIIISVFFTNEEVSNKK